ncbi:hypothetical protein [Agrobacterium rosae]|uniref:Uncharacterized protein n=1 Tax=Agrobacterium rosae TaxID=1972867 RepID=A0A1R3TGT6_9HYPH|nr:hypothetical protein [Agrobacterium rosae]SCX03982.1 hypothetical protein DSM25559_0377 [Agrobacterium rosae]
MSDKRHDPDWTSPKTGHHWRDDDLMLAVAWLKSLVPRNDIERRLEAAKRHLATARQLQKNGERSPLFDESDTIAWYILQAETFATDRTFFAPEGIMRAVPYLTRIGKELPAMLSVKGAEERAARMMTSDRRQPDGPLFELLVGLAWKRNGWKDVEFLPEKKGISRTPDLLASKPRTTWAVECKRMVPSTYAKSERAIGMKLAEPVHAMFLDRYKSFVVEVVYNVELANVPENYLVNTVDRALTRRISYGWNDNISRGVVRPVDWNLTRRVLAKDYVYYGGSRMIELLAGRYEHDADYSMTAKWRPRTDRPEYADAVYQASVVVWGCVAAEATKRRAAHFRRVLANAEGQLPSDIPSAIHIGIESYSGNFVDYYRHIQNRSEARSFQPTASRLRWVYANHFVPEDTTRQDETWALTETMVPYRVGKHGTKSPIPGHMLVSPEGDTDPWSHWSRPSG